MTRNPPLHLRGGGWAGEAHHMGLETLVLSPSFLEGQPGLPSGWAWHSPSLALDLKSPLQSTAVENALGGHGRWKLGPSLRGSQFCPFSRQGPPWGNLLSFQ